LAAAQAAFAIVYVVAIDRVLARESRAESQGPPLDPSGGGA